MPVNIGITAIQDNSTNQKSISKNEKEFILKSIVSKKLRIDGRKVSETRPITINFNRTSSSNGSIVSECLVYIGKTKVLTCISCDLSTPTYADRPNEGSINIKVDLSAMANIGFTESDTDMNSGGGDNVKTYYSQRIHRILERVLKNPGSGGDSSGAAIDAEALCVISGKAVWKLNITITILDDDGNIIDCSILSAFGALRFLKLPATDIINDGKHIEIYNEDDRDPIPLPLHHTPIPFSFALFSSSLDEINAHGSAQQENEELLQCIVDPNQREELLCSGLVTFCFNKHKELCCIDFSSGTSVTRETLNQCASLAQIKVIELSNMLENALCHADQLLLEERLKRLHDKSFPSTADPSSSTPHTTDVTTTTPNVPFWEEMEGIDLDINESTGTATQNPSKQKQDNEKQQQLKDEQQAYRLQALDFDHLHHAVSVKEPEEKEKAKKKDAITINQSSSLFQAMIHSANQNQQQTLENDNSIIDKVDTVQSKNKKQTSETILEQDDNDQMQIDNSKIEDFHNDSDEEEVTILQNEFISATSSNNKTSKVMEIEEDNDGTKSKKQKNVNDIIHNLKKQNKKKLKKRNQKK